MQLDAVGLKQELVLLLHHVNPKDPAHFSSSVHQQLGGRLKTMQHSMKLEKMESTSPRGNVYQKPAANTIFKPTTFKHVESDVYCQTLFFSCNCHSIDL
ncbi:hypothetical protein INR49_028143 [Caranx melampygus]|nr:hypothetical protein INR49_028143 [Caranx melampygus]